MADENTNDPVVDATKNTPKQFKSLIPDYDAVSDEGDKAILDQIIASVNTDDPESAAEFGDEVLDKIVKSMSTISTELANDKQGLYANALENFTGRLEAAGVDGLKKRAGKLANSTAGVVGKSAAVAGRNLGTGLASVGGAAAAAAFVPGIGLPIAGAILAGGAIKTAYSEYKYRKSGDGEVEKLAEDLKKSITDIDDARQELVEAAKSIPQEKERIEKLKLLGEQSLIETAVYIGAGRKLQQMVAQEIADMEKDPSKEEDLKKRRAFLDLFSTKMATLVQTFGTAGDALAKAGQMQEALSNVQLSIRSITTWETASIQIQVATANSAVKTINTANKVQKTRDVMDRMRGMTNEATNKAQQMARDTRPDSAVRINAFNQYLEQVVQHQKNATTTIANFRKDSEAALAVTTQKVDELVKAMDENERKKSEIMSNVGQNVRRTSRGTTVDTTSSLAASFGKGKGAANDDSNGGRTKRKAGGSNPSPS